jgi:DNA-binding CsgD family transcriptional regulator
MSRMPRTMLPRPRTPLLGREGDRWWVAKPISDLAAVAARQGLGTTAARLLGVADAVWELSAAPILPFDQPNFTQAREGALLALGPDGFAAAYAAGRTMLWLDVETEADALVATLTDPARLASDSPLSMREREILQYLAAGHTDQQIANALFISRRTVNAHVSNILRRLDVRSRQEAVQLAWQRGFLRDAAREPASDLHNPSQKTLSECTPGLQDMRHSIDGVA